ncbi:MAG: hypothetical protein ACRCST_13060 [Turicibacter sp.]
MSILIDNEFEIGELIFLKTCKDQVPRIITGILVRKKSHVYYISNGENESAHYDFEISREKDVKLATTN